MKSFVLPILTLCFLVACQPSTDHEQNQSTTMTGCNKEAKVCPDGQTVHRNPTRGCDFDPCPEPASEIDCMDDMKQCPDGSFVTRDAQNNCQFMPCEDNAQNKEPIVYCTQDVMQCDDGSYVGRDPEKNCAFKPCPDGSQPERSKPRIE